MADFSRKHYVIIANLIRAEVDKAELFPTEQMREILAVIEQLVVQMAGLFGADNPQFDWHRFYTACGLDADKLLSEEA